MNEKELPTSPLRFKVKNCEKIEGTESLFKGITEETKIKVTFQENSLEEEAKGWNGIYLLLELTGDTQKKPVSSPNKWLTDDNVVFILRHKEFINEKEVQLLKSETSQAIQWGRDFEVRTDLANIYLANQIAKWKSEGRIIDETFQQQLRKFKDGFNTGIAKYTIFPMVLGEHPGNHWGMLVMERDAGGSKIKGTHCKVYWTSSLYQMEEEAKQIRPLIEYLTGNNKIKINTSQLKGEKQINGEDCGVYLCLYIKDLVEYKTRKNETVGKPLHLGRSYGSGGVEKFRKEWKNKVEFKEGIGRWCKKGTPVKKPIKKSSKGKHTINFEPISLESAEGLRAYIEDVKKWADENWLKDHTVFVKTQGTFFNEQEVLEGIIIDKRKCKNEGGWERAKELILNNKGKQLELTTNEVVWAGKEESEGDYSDALKTIREHCYLIIAEDFWVEEPIIRFTTYDDTPYTEKSQPKETKYPELLEEAQNNGWEVELNGIWEREKSDQFEFWLVTTETYTLLIQPPKEVKPTLPGKKGVIEITSHTCPYLELPKREEELKKQFGEKINELETSENKLIEIRKELNNQLNKANRNIKEMCEFWDKSDLGQLKAEMIDRTRMRDTYKMERDHAQEEIKRLEKVVEKQKKSWNWMAGEIALSFKLLVGEEVEKGITISNKWLEEKLGGKTLPQILQARDNKIKEVKDWEEKEKKISNQHGVNKFEEVSEKLLGTEKNLQEEKGWWNLWMSESSGVTTIAERDLGKNSTFVLEAIQLFEKKGKKSYELREKGEFKQGRVNMKALYEYYRPIKSEEINNLEKLEEKVRNLIGTDFTAEQIQALHELFAENGLPQTYNFIVELTSLTNNHKIRGLEELAKGMKESLVSDNYEQLEEKKESLEAPLLEVALPETLEFILEVFNNWISLLKEIEVEETDEELPNNLEQMEEIRRVLRELLEKKQELLLELEPMD